MKLTDTFSDSVSALPCNRVGIHVTSLLLTKELIESIVIDKVRFLLLSQ